MAQFLNHCPQPCSKPLFVCCCFFNANFYLSPVSQKEYFFSEDKLYVLFELLSPASIVRLSIGICGPDFCREGKCEWFEIVPKFKHSNQICVNPKLYLLQDSSSLESWSFKLKVLYQGGLAWKWQEERMRRFLTNHQLVTADESLGEHILGKG